MTDKETAYLVVLETGSLRLAGKPLRVDDPVYAAEIALRQNPVFNGVLERSQSVTGAPLLSVVVFQLADGSGEPALEAHPIDVLEGVAVAEAADKSDRTDLTDETNTEAR